MLELAAFLPMVFMKRFQGFKHSFPLMASVILVEFCEWWLWSYPAEEHNFHERSCREGNVFWMSVLQINVLLQPVYNAWMMYASPTTERNELAKKTIFYVNWILGICLILQQFTAYFQNIWPCAWVGQYSHFEWKNPIPAFDALIVQESLPSLQFTYFIGWPLALIFFHIRDLVLVGGMLILFCIQMLLFGGEARSIWCFSGIFWIYSYLIHGLVCNIENVTTDKSWYAAKECIGITAVAHFFNIYMTGAIYEPNTPLAAPSDWMAKHMTSTFFSIAFIIGGNAYLAAHDGSLSKLQKKVGEAVGIEF